MTFGEYLRAAGIAAVGARARVRSVERWLAWLSERSKDETRVEYLDVLAYVDELREAGRRPAELNRVLGVIRYYCAYRGVPDPTYGLRVRGQQVSAPPVLLDAETLAAVYAAAVAARWPARRSGYGYTDELVLGLVVWQGLEQAELGRLEVGDVDVASATVRVPAGRYRLGRLLRLEGHQVLAWAGYLQQGRAAAIAAHERRRPGYGEALGARLLPGGGLDGERLSRESRLHGQLIGIAEHVRTVAERELGVAVASLRVLRQARIAAWVETEGLRRARYLSGLRTVEQVERYDRGAFEDLERQVGRFHPLR